MTLQATTLLCLVLCLGQKIQAQKGVFPVPTISAYPSAVIPWNGSARILCRGTLESFLYRLLIIENSTDKVVEQKLGFQKEAEFIIDHMNTATAGSYRCQYRKEQTWSNLSEPLELMVTGVYDKPVLDTDQSLVVMLGDNITFRCGAASVSFDSFSLAKEGDASLSQYQYGTRQGNFTVGPMNPHLTGNYQCYGWHSSSPYVWSAPSDALELITDSRNQDHTIMNWIRMAIAGMVLVVLLVMLAENWYRRGASSKEGWQDLTAQSCSKQQCQT